MTDVRRFIDDFKVLQLIGWEQGPAGPNSVCFTHEGSGRIVNRKMERSIEGTMMLFVQELIRLDPMTNMSTPKDES